MGTDVPTPAPPTRLPTPMPTTASPTALPTPAPSFIPTAGLEEAVDTCPVEWNCDGHCYRLIGRKPKCHRKKTSESKCHKKKDVWCPERGDQAFSSALSTPDDNIAAAPSPTGNHQGTAWR